MGESVGIGGEEGMVRDCKLLGLVVLGELGCVGRAWLC